MKHNDFQKIRSTLLFSLVALIVFSCTRDDSAIDNELQIMQDKFIALKTNPSNQDFTMDFSTLKKGFTKGEAKGDIVMDLTSIFGAPYIEEYKFKVESKGGKIEGKFWVKDYAPGSGIVDFEAEGVITCVTFEEDCKTIRLGGEVTKALGYPELPENHFAVFTFVIDPDGTITATPIFTGQYPETVDYHCSVGIPVDDPFWWGIFLEVEGTAKMETKKCQKD